MIRLLRLARMGEVFNLLFEHIDSERLVGIIRILKLLTIMIGLGHLIACIWYGFGSMEEPETWLIASKYHVKPIGHQYVMSLRWAISQFAGGMDEVQPRSLPESIYAACVFLCAFCFGAIFISMLTSSMTQLSIEGSNQTMQLNALRRYLKQNGISQNLSLRLNRNAQHFLFEKQKTIP